MLLTFLHMLTNGVSVGLMLKIRSDTSSLLPIAWYVWNVPVGTAIVISYATPHGVAYLRRKRSTAARSSCSPDFANLASAFFSSISLPETLGAVALFTGAAAATTLAVSGRF